MHDRCVCLCRRVWLLIRKRVEFVSFSATNSQVDEEVTNLLDNRLTGNGQDGKGSIERSIDTQTVIVII